MNTRRLLLAACTLFCIACAPATTTPTPASGLVRPGDAVLVWVDPDLGAHAYAEAVTELTTLSISLGVPFEMAEGPDATMLRVRPFTATAPCLYWGSNRLVDHTAFVDARCAPSDLAFRAMVGHQLLHLLGARDLGDGAVMAPVSEDTQPLHFVPASYNDEPSARDVAEFVRVVPSIRWFE